LPGSSGKRLIQWINRSAEQDRKAVGVIVDGGGEGSVVILCWQQSVTWLDR
jgi:hypothetical protein